MALAVVCLSGSVFDTNGHKGWQHLLLQYQVEAAVKQQVADTVLSEYGHAAVICAAAVIWAYHMVLQSRGSCKRECMTDESLSAVFASCLLQHHTELCLRHITLPSKAATTRAASDTKLCY